MAASRDNTVAVLREYSGRLPLRLLLQPGANISCGRNVAIGAAGGDVIASADAGVWLEPQWLEKLTAPFESTNEQISESANLPSPNSPFANSPFAVAGFFVPDPQTIFEIAMGRDCAAHGQGGQAGDLPSLQPVRGVHQAGLGRTGGYPEWIDYCEDLIFDFRLRGRGRPVRLGAGGGCPLSPPRDASGRSSSSIIVIRARRR